MGYGHGRALAAGMAAALVLTACAGDDGSSPPAGAGQPDDGSAAGDAVAWTYLGVVESTLPDDAAAEVVTDADTLTAVWTEHGFEGGPPDVAFDDEVVLLLGRPDDACPDELIHLEVDGERLATEWLPPPGACNEPLLRWLHAVQVHRGVLAESFTYGPDAPFESELEPVTLELPPYAGDAPPAPEPPSAMDDAELDEVFAGHPVQPCGSEHELGRGGEVDGPLSDDPDVAAAQQGRAEHGVASDEATTREVMEHPDRLAEYGFPLLPEEQDADLLASALIGEVMAVLEADGWDLGGDRMPGATADRGMVVAMIDRSDGIRAAVVVGPDDEVAVRELLDREVDEGAAVAVVVDERWPPALVADAQDAVVELMSGAGEPGSITWVSGPPGPVQIGMIDPTREALDEIAAVVEPALVCVSVELSGVPAGG